MYRTLLLGCGLVSTLVYLAMDILGTLAWDGYSYIDQTISELAALGAPSRPMAVALAMLYNLLLIPFAVGVAITEERNRWLRLSGVALAGIGIAGIIAAFFPIQMRGTGTWTINETMHVALTAVIVVLIIGAMSFSARAAGRRFFVFSLVSMAVTLVAGAAAGLSGGNIADNLPTPWLGVMERISIFAYLAWVAALSLVLMRRPPAAFGVRAT